MHHRTILLKIHIWCLVALAQSQSYEYNSEDGDTESDIEGDSRPDYSKYYSVTPKDGGLNFPGFGQPQANFGFGPFEAAFGASTQEKQKLIPTQEFIPEQTRSNAEANNGFAQLFAKHNFDTRNQPQDYFEQSQSRQREETKDEVSEDSSDENEEQNDEDDDKTHNIAGPNYISHEKPAKIPYQVEAFKSPGNVRKTSINHVIPQYHDARIKDYKDHYKPVINYNAVPLTQINTHPNLYLYPQAPGITKAATSQQLSPYQKYSFQPAAEYQNKYLENLYSPSNTNANYETKFPKGLPLSYQNHKAKIVTRSADKKNCKKVKRKSGSDEIGDLTCYVCENEETNSKVTECSYQSEPDSTDLHKGNSQRYSVPAKAPNSFRFRRYASEEDSDPYEYVKSRSLKAQNEKQDDEGEYNYEGYDESQPEKSYSEVQSEAILKDPKKCTDVERDGMSCRVCKDPETGGNYESCSFSRTPKPEKYAYVSEKNYNSDDDPEYAAEGDESKNIPTKSKEVSDETKSDDIDKVYKKDGKKKKYSRNSGYRKPKGSKPEYPDYKYPKNYNRYKNSKSEKSSYSPNSNPNYEAETQQRPEVVESKTDGNIDESTDSTEDISPYKDIEEYQFKYFPEYSDGESRGNAEPLNSEATNRKEVEDVLADFQKRDRSQCKQTKKNGMTCFLCVNENKVKNEECMFISESRPKGMIAKYTKTDEVVSPTHQKPSVIKKKPHRIEKDSDIEGAASSEVETVVKPPSKRKTKKALKTPELNASASARDSQRIKEDEDDPKIETPVEFQTPDEGGAYSAETKPVYSKTLAMTLPRYMLQKSEFEKEFDAFSAHN